jgi:lambda family phage portal protein
LKLKDRIIKRLGGFTRKDFIRSIKRAYSGAGTGRLYSSWTTTNQSSDAELRFDLTALRARSRELERNNDYAKKFLRMVRTNVVGQNGIRLQSQVVNEKGEPDRIARDKIEESWINWGSKGICDVTGELNFRDIQKMAISSVGRDGEVLIRKVRGYDNPFKYSLQLIEADHLDEKYNVNLENGNRIKMGKEIDPWGRPVAYHIYKEHPGDALVGLHYGEKLRIPAEEIIHLYIPQRISQSRGIPWMHAALTRFNMLGGYEEAELTAARIAAAKGGFYEKESGTTAYQGDTTEEGQPIQEVEPGIFEVLPDGWKFTAWDPQHPTTSYKDFIKAILRGISSGLDVSYNYLANDLEGVNYSSIRAGVLDERDVWRDIQAFMAEHLLQPIFEEWLNMALVTKQVNLPFSKYDKFKTAKWQPRGWQWVDPQKDIMAKILEINSGLNTGTAIAAEQGKDLEEVFKELAAELQLAKKYGIILPEIQLKPEVNPDGNQDN